jgi:hypothetical protein
MKSPLLPEPVRSSKSLKLVHTGGALVVVPVTSLFVMVATLEPLLVLKNSNSKKQSESLSAPAN